MFIGVGLSLNQRMIVLNRVGDPRGRRRFDPNATRSSDHLKGPGYLEIGLGSILGNDASRLNQLDEGRRTAVHHRRFTGIDLHIDVIDIQACQRRQNVLNRLDLKAVAADSCAEFGRNQMFDGGREGSPRMPVAVDKDDPGICWGRS